MSITDAEVFSLIADGNKLSAIADLTGLPKGEIVRVAREAHYALNVSSDRFQPAPQSKPKPEGIVRSAGTGQPVGAVIPSGTVMTGGPFVPAPETGAEIRPAQRDVIAEGKAHSAVRVQRAAVKAEVALATLVDLLNATREEEAAKRKAEAEKAAARAEVERLEQQLADAKAKLRGPARVAAVAVVAPNQAGASAKEIRAWAEDAGVDCPTVGKVPARVVDAYLAAHQEGAA